jgi:hypothetical protein
MLKIHTRVFQKIIITLPKNCVLDHSKPLKYFLPCRPRCFVLSPLYLHAFGVTYHKKLIIQLPTGIVYYFASSTLTEFSLKKIESALTLLTLNHCIFDFHFHFTLSISCAHFEQKFGHSISFIDDQMSTGIFALFVSLRTCVLYTLLSLSVSRAASGHIRAGADVGLA